MTVATISDELRTRFELPEAVKGVVIVEVKEGGPAGAESLRPGDVIVEVGQEEVDSPPEVAAKVSQAQQDNKKSVLLLVDRQGDLRFVALRFPDQGGARRGGAPSAWQPLGGVPLLRRRAPRGRWRQRVAAGSTERRVHGRASARGAVTRGLGALSSTRSRSWRRPAGRAAPSGRPV